MNCYAAVENGLQLGDVNEFAAADARALDIAEHALAHVQPVGTGWGQWHIMVRMPAQPCMHFRMRWSGVVVHGQVQLRGAKCATFQQSATLPPLQVATGWAGHRPDFAIGHDVHGQRNGGRAFALMAVSYGLAATGAAFAWQSGLGALQGLDLVCVVMTRDRTVLRCNNAQAADALQLLDEERIGDGLERTHPLSLQSVGARDTPHRPCPQRQVDSCAADAQVSRPRQRLLKARAHHVVESAGVAHRVRASRADRGLLRTAKAFDKACRDKSPPQSIRSIRSSGERWVPLPSLSPEEKP